HEDSGASACAQILRAHLDFNRAVRIDRERAGALVPASAPGVNRKAQTALHWSGTALPARMPVLLPADEIGGDHQLIAIGPGTVEGVCGGGGGGGGVLAHDPPGATWPGP